MKGEFLQMKVAASSFMGFTRQLRIVDINDLDDSERLVRDAKGRIMLSMVTGHGTSSEAYLFPLNTPDEEVKRLSDQYWAEIIAAG